MMHTFDLFARNHYNRQLDLTETCDDTFSTCQCSDAEQKIANGRINCETDRCPPECEACRYCLTDILDCYKDEPSPVPSTVPTTKPTKLPSKLPTLSPFTLAPTASFDLTVAPTLSPLLVFDLQNCVSYSDRW